VPGVGKMGAGAVRVVLGAMLVLGVVIGACDDGSEPPEGALSVAELLASPIYDEEVVVHGEIQDLGDLLCPCFTLRSGDAPLAVWYDLMIDDDGTQWPGVDVSGVENGDHVVVTGELRRPGTAQAQQNFWSVSIEKLD